jgi:hypothetical protein
MTPETRKLLRGFRPPSTVGEQAKNFGLENFLYGNAWFGTAAYYKATYPGFTDDQCKAMEAFSNGVTPKQYRNILKKEKRKQQASCSGSKLLRSSSSAFQNSYATNQSTSK